MRRTLLLALLLFPLAGMAQVTSPSIILVESAPSGSCAAGLPNRQVASTGLLYSCQSGTWTEIGGSGGGVTFPTGLLYGNDSTVAPTVATAAQVSALVTGAINPSSTGATTPGSVAATTISATGGITAISDGVHAGGQPLVCNTTNPATSAFAQGWYGSTASATCTPYGLNVPSVAPAANQFMLFPAPTSSYSQGTWESITGAGAAVPTGPTSSTNTDLVSYSGTAGMQQDSGIASGSVVTLTGTQTLTNKTLTSPSINQATVTTPDSITKANCLAAASPVATPCIAAQGGATALGNSGTSGTITLYTTSAPAGMFTVCPVVWVTTSAGTGPGNITLALTYTSPGSLGISAYTVNTTAITAYDGFNTCNTVATKSGTTFSFVIAASGASGTASSWEYSYVVTRLE